MPKEQLTEEDFENDDIMDQLSALEGLSEAVAAANEKEPEESAALAELDQETDEEVAENEEANEEPSEGNEAEETVEEVADEEESTEPEEPTEEDDKDSRIEALIEQNQKMMQLLNAGGQLEMQSEEDAAPTVTEEQTLDQQTVRAHQAESLSYQAPELTDETYEELLSDKDKFASYIQDMGQQIRQQAMQEQGAIVNRILDVKTRVNQFFSDEKNADILPLAQFVRDNAIKLEKQNPNLSVEEVLTASAKMVRGSIASGQKIKSGTATKKPAAKKFPSKTSPRRPAQAKGPRLSAEEEDDASQIDDMFNLQNK